MHMKKMLSRLSFLLAMAVMGFILLISAGVPLIVLFLW